MEPIEVVLKDREMNVFTERVSGELMVVHRCVSCGKVQVNRVAGDDNAQLIYELPSCEDKGVIGNILWGY